MSLSVAFVAFLMMHSALLVRTARRVAIASPSPHLAHAFSAKRGPNPPKNSVQGTPRAKSPSPASDTTHPHPPRPSPSQTTSTDISNAPESDTHKTPISVQPTSLSLDFAPPEPGTERERTGAKSSKDSLSSIERRRRQLGRVSFGLFAIGLLSGCVYLGREWTEDELVSRKLVRVPSHRPLALPRAHVRSERRSRTGFTMGSYNQQVLVHV